MYEKNETEDEVTMLKNKIKTSDNIIVNSLNVLSGNFKNVIVKSEDIMATFCPGYRDSLRCRVCGYLSATETQSYIHFVYCKKQRNKMYECTSCKRTFKKRKLFFEHLKRKHRMNIKYKKNHQVEDYICYFCNKKYQKKNDIENHIVEHMGLGVYHCDLCGSGFKKILHLRKHIYRVHLEKDIPISHHCSICSKIFSSTQAARNHEISHAMEKRVQCHHCSKPYSNKFSLVTHIQNVHMKTELEKMKEPINRCICDICGNSYRRKNALNEHRRKVHEGKFPECSVCGKKVGNKTSLKIHMVTHTGVKPHCCEICGKSFVSGAYLKIHMLSHTGEMPHVCHVCPKKYSQRSSYIYHYRKYHPGIVPPNLKKFK